jgi:hypothetical protein
MSQRKKAMCKIKHNYSVIMGQQQEKVISSISPESDDENKQLKYT